MKTIQKWKYEEKYFCLTDKNTICWCYQELKSPKLVLPLDFLAVDAAVAAAAPLVDGPLSSSAAERFLKEKNDSLSVYAGYSCAYKQH